MELIGLYLVAAALLVGAGVAKALRPDDTARAFGSTFRIRPERLRAWVRVGAAVEVAVGIVALAWPGPVPAALVAASYFVFAATLAVVRSTGGAIGSCGCFGSPDTPATITHVVANACLGAAAVAVAAAHFRDSVLGVLADQPWRGVPLLMASLLAAWLTLLVMDQMARLTAVRRLVGISHRPVV